MSLTAVSVRVGRHEWGVLNTASAAFSHSEGSRVTWVAIQSRGSRSTHREVTYFQLVSPAICVCVWLYLTIYRYYIFNTLYY